jgi:hypothetical protein
MIGKKKKKEHQTSPDAHAAYQRALLWGAVSNSMQAAFWSLYFILRDSEVLDEVLTFLNQGKLIFMKYKM